MSQAQTTYSLIMAYFQMQGINTKRDQSRNAAVMKEYNDLSKIIADYKRGVMTIEGRERLQEIKNRFSAYKLAEDNRIKLLALDLKQEDSIRDSATKLREATIQSRTRLTIAQQNNIDNTFERIASEVTAPSGQSQDRQVVAAFLGSLTSDGTTDRIKTAAYPEVINAIKTKYGIDLRSEAYQNSLPPDMKNRVQEFVSGAEKIRVIQSEQERELDAVEAEMEAAVADLGKIKGIDEAAQEKRAEARRRLSDGAAKANAIFDARDGGEAKQQEVIKIIRQSQEEDEFLKRLDARHKMLDAQLAGRSGQFSGSAGQTKTQRIAQIIGRDNFRQWAYDNGYTDDDLGFVTLNAKGQPIMDTYSPGKRSTRAILQFEHQLKRPGSQSRLFGPRRQTNELHIFDLVIDDEMAEGLKHGDGQWRTIVVDGKDQYVTQDEINEYRDEYLTGTVQLARFDGVDTPFLKAGDDFYTYDEATNTYNKADLPEGKAASDAKLSSSLVTQDNEGVISRYVTVDDLNEGTEGFRITDFRLAKEGEVETLAASYADLGIKSTGQPPPGSTRRVRGIRLRTHQKDVIAGKAFGNNAETYIDTDTGLEIRIDPKNKLNTEVHETRPSTNFRDFKTFLRKRKMSRLRERTLDKTAGDPSEERTVNGHKVKFFGTSETNLYDKAMSTIEGPDLKPTRAERTAYLQEVAVNNAREDRINAAAVVPVLAAAAEAAEQRFNSAPEGSPERRQAYQEMLAAQKANRDALEALGDIERNLRTQADELAAAATTELPEEGDAPLDTPEDQPGRVRGTDMPAVQRGEVLAAAADDAASMRAGGLETLKTNPQQGIAMLRRAYELGDEKDDSILLLISAAEARQGNTDEAQRVLDQYTTKTTDVDIAPGSNAARVSRFIGDQRQAAVEGQEAAEAAEQRRNQEIQDAIVAQRRADDAAREAEATAAATAEREERERQEAIEERETLDRVAREDASMQATVREFVADLEAEDARAAQQKIAGTTPEAARTQEEIRRAQLPEDLVDPEDPAAGAAALAAAREASKDAPPDTRMPTTQADIDAAMAEVDRDSATERRVERLKEAGRKRRRAIASMQRAQEEEERAAKLAAVTADQTLGPAGSPRSMIADALRGRDEKNRQPAEAAPPAQEFDAPEEIEFQPTQIEVEETQPQGGPSLMQEAARDPSSRGQPSRSSPTDTAQVTTGVGVPGERDKFVAESKELIKKNMQIRDMIYGNQRGMA